jgi:PAS domain S-box-containing protein
MAGEMAVQPLQALVAELCALTGAAGLIEDLEGRGVTTFGDMPAGHAPGAECPQGGAGQLVERVRIVEQHGRRWRVRVVQDAGERVAAERDRTRYKAIVDTHTDWIARERPDGTLTFVNEAYCQWMGMTREQLLSADHCGLDLVDDPDDLARFRANRAALRPERASAVNELRTRHPDGSKRWEQWTDTAIFDCNGAVVEYQLVGREITEQKQTEIALRRSEELLRAIVDTQTEWIVRQRPDGRYTFVNPAFCLSMGKTAAQLMAPEHDCLAVLDPQSLAHLLRNRARLTPQSPTVLTEHPYRLPDGTVRWESWIETALFDGQGQVVEYQCVGRDITDRVLAEAALRTSEERYRNVVESQNDLITRIRPDGRATFVNDAYCRYMSMTREQLLDPSWDDLLYR